MHMNYSIHMHAVYLTFGIISQVSSSFTYIYVYCEKYVCA